VDETTFSIVADEAGARAWSDLDAQPIPTLASRLSHEILLPYCKQAPARL